MSTGSEDIRDIKGTYLGELIDYKPEHSIADFWALVCCGWDLHHPYDGWSGYVAIPIFANQATCEMYFGDLPATLAEYENIPEHLIQRSVSKESAYDQLCAYIYSVSKCPVLISANADTWAKRIMKDADQHSASTPREFDHLCVRNLYSLVRAEDIISRSGSKLSDALSGAKPLAKRFGLHAIADALNVTAECCSTKAKHRAQLLAEVSRKLLLTDYPLQ